MITRRSLLVGISAAASLALVPLQALARVAFTVDSKDKVLKELYGDLLVEESSAIKFKIPDIAENGAVVPVSVATDIDGVEQISIIIDNNPNPLSAVFNIGEQSMPDISTRIKVGDSSIARAMVKTSDKVYTTQKEVKVTIGGCGG